MANSVQPSSTFYTCGMPLEGILFCVKGAVQLFDTGAFDTPDAGVLFTVQTLTPATSLPIQFKVPVCDAWTIYLSEDLSTTRGKMRSNMLRQVLGIPQRRITNCLRVVQTLNSLQEIQASKGGKQHFDHQSRNNKCCKRCKMGH